MVSTIFVVKVLKGIIDDHHPQSRGLRETLKGVPGFQLQPAGIGRDPCGPPEDDRLSSLILRNHEHRILFELALKAHELGVTTLKA